MKSFVSMLVCLSTTQHVTNIERSMPLSAEYESFVNDRDSLGTVVIAFGHYVKWDKAPSAVFTSFLLAFSKLKRYRFVWQCGVNFAKKFQIPKHILIREWLPQTALLNHPKTVLFISHVGLKSFIEALCARVPIVTLPLFAEQHVNAMIVNNRGIGVDLDRYSLSAQKVESAVIDSADPIN
ncbi:unnamed protein product [Soboliphyme baturini]|uniref:glucuronosyltransferase n=1 Tax=Soboliphyme baturini TaxID=241478 RepID=A0A183J5J6_9BILA|nr:unnamed protein product [Soboliphyme baturini]